MADEAIKEQQVLTLFLGSYNGDFLGGEGGDGVSFANMGIDQLDRYPEEGKLLLFALTFTRLFSASPFALSISNEHLEKRTVHGLLAPEARKCVPEEV